MKITLLGLLLFITSTYLQADEAISPIEKYKSNTRYHILMCQLKNENSTLQSQLGEKPDKNYNVYDCIKTAKEKINDSFKLAINDSKNEKSKAFLKEYHITFLTALDGVAPNINERNYEYKKRQFHLKEKMDESWNRFEVENI